MSLPTINPAVRVGFSLMMFTISVLLIADLFGMVPDREKMLMEARKKVCESLAVQLSLAASDSNMDLVEASLESFAARNDDVVAVSMSQENGVVVAEYGEFKLFDKLSTNIRSSKNMIIVPVFSGEKRWGSVNVEFDTIGGGGFIATLAQSDYIVLVFIAMMSFIGYLFMTSIEL